MTVNPPATRTHAATAAAVCASVVVLGGCSIGVPVPPEEPDGEVILTLATFGDFGYTDALLEEFTAETGIAVVHTTAAEPGDARANLLERLGGPGLADVEAIEADRLAELMPYSELLAPVPADLHGRWLDWKEAAATDARGNLIGYGTGIGPQAVCYRSDLFEAADLPTSRAEVGELLGTWDDFFTVGADYTATTGLAFVDSADSVFQALVDQLDHTYEHPDGTIVATGNPAVRDAYDTTVEEAIPIAAFARQWGDDWFASMSDGEFAVMLCPSWMLEVIALSAPDLARPALAEPDLVAPDVDEPDLVGPGGAAPDLAGWDVADVFPGGGGNRGGSYLIVPANGAHVSAAQQLADWLTSPAVQIRAFVEAGAFPSQPEAYDDPALTGVVDAYFGYAPTGLIGIDRAEAVAVSAFRGPRHHRYHDALRHAITRVFDGQDAESSWDTWVAEVSAF